MSLKIYNSTVQFVSQSLTTAIMITWNARTCWEVKQWDCHIDIRNVYTSSLSLQHQPQLNRRINWQDLQIQCHQIQYLTGSSQTTGTHTHIHATSSCDINTLAFTFLFKSLKTRFKSRHKWKCILNIKLTATVTTVTKITLLSLPASSKIDDVEVQSCFILAWVSQLNETDTYTFYCQIARLCWHPHDTETTAVTPHSSEHKHKRSVDETKSTSGGLFEDTLCSNFTHLQRLSTNIYHKCIKLSHESSNMDVHDRWILCNVSYYIKLV